jgi:hypothetical protein
VLKLYILARFILFHHFPWFYLDVYEYKYECKYIKSCSWVRFCILQFLFASPTFHSEDSRRKNIPQNISVRRILHQCLKQLTVNVFVIIESNVISCQGYDVCLRYYNAQDKSVPCSGNSYVTTWLSYLLTDPWQNHAINIHKYTSLPTDQETLQQGAQLIILFTDFRFIMTSS